MHETLHKMHKTLRPSWLAGRRLAMKIYQMSIWSSDAAPFFSSLSMRKKRKKSNATLPCDHYATWVSLRSLRSTTISLPSLLKYRSFTQPYTLRYHMYYDIATITTTISLHYDLYYNIATNSTRYHYHHYCTTISLRSPLQYRCNHYMYWYRYDHHYDIATLRVLLRNTISLHYKFYYNIVTITTMISLPSLHVLQYRYNYNYYYDIATITTMISHVLRYRYNHDYNIATLRFILQYRYEHYSISLSPLLQSEYPATNTTRYHYHHY